MLALGEAAFGTGGGHGGVGDIGVTQRRNHGLRCENFTAGRAMLALGKAAFGTGGGHGGVGDLGVNVRSDAVRKDHFSLRIELIPSNRNRLAVGEGLSCHLSGIQVHGGIPGDFVPVGDEVKIAVILHQLVAGLHHVVDVQVIANHAVLRFRDHHFPFGIKLIGSGGNGSAVGEGHARYPGGAQVHGGVDGELIAVGDIIEVALVLNKLIGPNGLTVPVEEAAVRSGVQNGHAVTPAIVVERAVSAGKFGNARLHISVPIEKIGLTVDFIGSGGGKRGGGVTVVAGAVPVAGARGGGDPDAACEAAVFKEELHAVVGVLAAVQPRVGSLIKVIPLIVDRLPAAQQLAVDQIVGLITHELKPRAVKGLTAVRTDQLVALDGVDMTRSGEDGSPAHHRAALGAGGSARVTRLKGGGSLVGHRHDGVLVEALAVCHASVDPRLRAHHGILGGVVEEQLGIHRNIGHPEGAEGIRLAVGGVGDLTLYQRQFNALRPEVALQDLSSGGLVRFGDPGADGDRGQDRPTRSGILPRAGDDDGSDVVVSLDGVGSGEACGKSHALQFPNTAVVEIQRKLHLVDGLDVGGHEIQPVERTDQKAVGVGIAGDELNRGRVGAALYLNRTVGPCHVAVLVGDAELDRVDTVGQGHARDGDLAVFVGAGDLHAVNIGVGGASVKAGGVGEGGIVGHGDRENRGVTVDGLTPHGLGVARDRHRGSRKDGGAVIRDSVGVVEGDVVYVEGILTIEVEAVRGGGISVNGEVDGGNGASRDGGGDIVPALLQRGELTACEAAVTEFQGYAASIVGNVDPEAYGGSARGVNGGEGHLQSMLPRGADLGEIAVDRQNKVAVLALAAASVHHAKLTHGIAADSVQRPACQLPSFGVPHKLVLKGVGELGALAETDGRGSGDTAHLSGQGGGQSGQILLSRGEVEAIDGANARSRQGKGHVRGAEGHGMTLKGSVQSEIYAAAKGNCHIGGCKGEGIGGDDMDGLFTHRLAVHGHFYSHAPLLAVRYEQARIAETAKGTVGQFPEGIGGNIRGGPAVIHACGAELNRAAGGIVIGIRGNTGFLKLSCRGCGGDDENAVGGGALRAVRGRAVQLQLLAGALGQEGGGSAAVAVEGPDTAEGDHELRHLIAVEAAGEGLLAALVHDDDDGAVCLDAHEGTGSGRLGIIDGVYIFAVLHQGIELNGDQLLLPARNAVVEPAHLGLGHVGRAGNAVLLIEVDDKTGGGPPQGALAVGVFHAVHNQSAQGLTDQLGVFFVILLVVPVQRNVRSGDHVAVAVLLGILDLLGHDLNLVLFVFQTLRHFIGAGHDLGVGVMGIHLHYVAYLAVGAVLLGQNDLGFSNTGSQLPVPFGDQLEVVTLVLCVLDSECCHRGYAYEHERTQEQRDQLGRECFFHGLSPF